MNVVVSLATPIIKHSLSRPQEPPKAHARRTGRVRIAGQKKRANKTPTPTSSREPWPMVDIQKTSHSGSLTRCMMAEEEGFEPSYGEYP